MKWEVVMEVVRFPDGLWCSELHKWVCSLCVELPGPILSPLCHQRWIKAHHAGSGISLQTPRSTERYRYSQRKGGGTKTMQGGFTSSFQLQHLHQQQLFRRMLCGLDGEHTGRVKER